MKKIFLTLILIYLTLSGYSQSKHIKLFEEKANSILKIPIDDKNYEAYNNLKHETEMKRYTYHSDGRQGKKNDAIINTIKWRISDSITLYDKRKEEFRFKERRIAIIADSLRKDSIKKVEVALKIKLAQQDSIRRETQREFFSVESIVKNIGKNPYSKENIENTLSIYPSAFKGTWTFYDVSDKFISIKYFGLEDICIELGFRIFGEDAALYKKELMKAGFKYQKTFRETMIENHSQGYSNLSGTEIQRYRKYTGKDYIICDIYYDRFTFFKFYRARYKK